MAVVEIALGALVALAGGGAGWLGRGKFDAAQRARANEQTKAVKSAKRVAGGLKAAQTRAAKAAKGEPNKVVDLSQQGQQAKTPLVAEAQNLNGSALLQRQQFQNGRDTVDSSLYGRNGGEL